MSRPLLVIVSAIVALTAASGANAQGKPTPATGNTLPRTQFITDMDSEFRKMDADKNGLLTRTEIEQYQKLQAIAQSQARNRQLFVQLDADRNGQLSPAEFAKVATPAPAANAQPMLARMDGNKDQQVSIIEHRAATLANFDRIDTDKDGFVTPAEMKASGVVTR